MRIYRYILTNFLRSVLLTALFLMAILFLVDVIDQFGKIVRFNGTFFEALILSIIRIPIILVNYLPLILLIASLICFLNLSRNSELVIVRAMGISIPNAIIVPLLSGFIIGLLIITIFNPILTKARTVAENYLNRFQQTETALIVYQSPDGTWIKDRQNEEDRFMRYSQYDSAQEIFYDVEIFAISANQKSRIYEAQSASLKDGILELRDVQIYETPNPQPQSTEVYELPSSLTHRGLTESLRPPQQISNINAYQYLQNLYSEGYDLQFALSYFLQQAIMPVYFMTMILIGAIFALRPQRSGGVAARVLFTLVMGFVVYGIYHLSIAMGKSGQIPIVLSVFIVPISSFFLAYAQLIHQEDG